MLFLIISSLVWLFSFLLFCDIAKDDEDMSKYGFHNKAVRCNTLSNDYE